MRISDWSSDVCSSDLRTPAGSISQSLRLRGVTLSSHLPGTRSFVNTVDFRPFVNQRCSSVAKISFCTPLRDRLIFQSRRSEEHTSELQSLMRISYAVFCLKKKNNINQHIHIISNTS